MLACASLWNQMVEQRLRLGQLLVDASIISQDQLDEVLLMQKQDGRKLGTLLVERGFINETQLTQILSQQLSVPWVSLYHVDFSKRLLSLVPRDVAEKFCLVPIYVRHVRGQGDTLYVAMDDPTNDEALKSCSMWSGLPTRAMIASPTDIRDAIRVYYSDGRKSAPPPAMDQPAQAAEAAPAAEPKPAEAAQAPKPVEEPPRKPVDSIPPAPESASAWKAPGQKVEAWSPDASEFEAKAEPAPMAPEPAAPAAAEPEAAAASPREERVEQAAADLAEQQAEALPAAVSAPEQQVQAPASEAAPAEQAGTLEGAAPEPSTEEESRKEDQVTLEVGEEVPLESLLPEGKELPHKRPMTGAERLMSLTLLDGTRLALPVRRLKKEEEGGGEPPRRPRSVPPPLDATPAPLSRPLRVSQPPAEIRPEVAYTARDLIAALRASAHGVDAADLIGQEPKWQSILAALVAVMLRRGLIDEKEFIDELNKV
jgi:hypothetical protein